VKSTNLALFLFLLCTGITINAQNNQVDSLKTLLNNLGEDITKVNTLNAIANGLYRADPDEAIRYSSRARNLAVELNYPEGEALANKNIGLGFYMQGEFSEAVRYWEPALALYEELGNDQLVANLLSNMGAVYYTTGKFVEAMELFLPALKKAEELNDSTRISTLLLNIGAIYSESPNTHDEALYYYRRAIEMGEALGDLDVMGVGTLNLGVVYVEKEEYDSALYYFNKSLTILTGGIDQSSALNFMANIYSEKGEFSKALTLHRDALDLARKENGQREIVGILMGMASTYENLKNPEKAIEYFKEAESIAEEIGLEEELSGAYEGLANNYAEIEDYTNAYRNLSRKNEIDDIIYLIEAENKIAELMNDYEMEKKQNAITLLEQENEIRQLLNKRQKAISIVIGGVGLLVLAMAVGIYNRMRFIRTTNRKINKQKELITDSITYAQRIQSTILPSRELMKKLLPEHFVLYRPKDIVSGDFYWIKEVQDRLIIVGADCTGHGVPGAFMSMLGITMFNDLIGDNCYDAPGAILDKLRDKVKEMLLQEGNSDEQKDGMDLAIAVFNKTTREIHFSGANNPLYIIRKKNIPEQKDLKPYASIVNGDYRLFEIKGDKQPIGTHWEEKPFRTTSVYLREEDSFYMFSDGYIDQFGGENRKKFKSMNFKKLLLSVQEEGMDSQRNTLEQTFDQWRGPHEQLDDIIVLGIKV
jgi:serine phosphatase RsbU (regulator of sigma subunit)/Tfp pilus assembly protein PilF